jgi:Resolvase, N terminal domain
MIYGYARVSTDGQSVDAQVRQLTKAGCKKVFREAASGANPLGCGRGRRSPLTQRPASLLLRGGSRNGRLSQNARRFRLCGGLHGGPIVLPGSASRPCRRLPGSPRHCSRLELQCSFLGISLGSLVGGPAISHGGFAARSEDLGGNRHCRLDDQPGRHTQRSAVSGRSDRPAVSRAAETHAAATTDSTPLGTTGKVIVTVVPDARRLSMARLPP